jgi:hypothetical protein
MVFRPFEDSFLNGIWLFDNEFPRDECANDQERRGWDEGARYEDEQYNDQAGYCECIEMRSI